MDTVLMVLTLFLALVFAAVGAAKLAAVAAMRTAAAELGFSVTAYRLIGGVETAAAAGLLAGRFAGPGWLPLGMAAAVGCLLLMVGAVVAHLRVGDSVADMRPALSMGAFSAAVAVLQVLSL